MKYTTEVIWNESFIQNELDPNTNYWAFKLWLAGTAASLFVLHIEEVAQTQTLFKAKIFIMCLVPSFHCLITLCFECWLHFVHEIKHLLQRDQQSGMNGRAVWVLCCRGGWWVGDLCVHVVSDELAVIVITNCIRVEDWTGYISHCPQVGRILARLHCCTCSRSGVDLFTLIFCMQLVSCAQVSRQSSVIQVLYSSFLIILFFQCSQFILTLD